MLYFISDTHFGHKNIIKYSNRPFSSIEEMNEKMIESWNAMVRPNDTIFHLGDVAFLTATNLKETLARLNGNKHLILGNHDQTIRDNQSEFTTNELFQSIQSYKEVKWDNNLLCLFHFGQRVWNKSHHGSFHLYGHSHGSLPPYGKSVDVGVDGKEITSEYRPIAYEEIKDYMVRRPLQQADHHKDR